MKKFFLFLLILLVSVSAFAQNTATTASKYAWDITGPDLATVSGYTYKLYLDSNPAVTLTSVVCVAATGANNFTCSAPIGAITPGGHTFAITASNVAGESMKSASFAFSFVAIPSTPTNGRIQ